MKKKPTPEQEQLVANLGAILAGLQVPMSIGGPRILGAAYEPIVSVRDQLRLRGYPTPEEHVEALTKSLFG